MKYTNTSTVYAIRNIITDQIYIGCTQYFDRRILVHKRLATKEILLPKEQTPLAMNMRTYGIESFKFEKIKSFAIRYDGFIFERSLQHKLFERGVNLLNKYPFSKITSGRWVSPRVPIHRSILAKLIPS